jgi:hypothetical protein
MKDLRSKATIKAEILKRLEQCLAREDNLVCSECFEPNPTWASLLIPPEELAKEIKKDIKKDKKDMKKDMKKDKKDKHDKHDKKEKKEKVKATRKMGVFCCYKCCSYHYELGRQICEVKNIKVADECKLPSPP